MNDDDVHDLLTDEGARWRNGLGPDPELHRMLVRPEIRRRPVLRVAAVGGAAAALVAAVIVGVLLVSGSVSRPTANDGDAACVPVVEASVVGSTTRRIPVGQSASITIRLRHTSARAARAAVGHLIVGLFPAGRHDPDSFARQMQHAPQSHSLRVTGTTPREVTLPVPKTLAAGRYGIWSLLIQRGGCPQGPNSYGQFGPERMAQVIRSP